MMQNKLALGTVQFGLPYGISNQNGQVPLEEVVAILEQAWSYGIDTIDTAIAYGESEAVLGKAGIKNHPWKIVSKLPGIPEDIGDVSEWIENHVDQSLDRLRVECLDALLLHRSVNLLGQNGRELFSRIQKLKEQNKILKFGLSIYHPSELDNLDDKYQFDIIQAPMNIIDRRFFTSGWLDKLSLKGVEIHIRSVFLQGLLLLPWENIPVNFIHWENIWKNWQAWLKNNNAEPLCGCLEFIQNFSQIDRMVIGIDSLDQLKEIVKCMQHQKKYKIPDLSCEDEMLINPASWNSL